MHKLNTFVEFIFRKLFFLFPSKEFSILINSVGCFLFAFLVVGYFVRPPPCFLLFPIKIIPGK